MKSKEYSPLLASSGNQTNVERTQNRSAEQSSERSSYTECDLEGHYASAKQSATSELSSEQKFDENNG